MRLNPIIVRQKLQSFLEEDLGPTGFYGPEGREVHATITAQESGIFCGGIFIRELFDLLKTERTRQVSIEYLRREGQRFSQSECLLAKLVIDSAVLCSGIRVALNLLGRLSGIATNTKSFVDQIPAYPTVLLDTRKTTPGFQLFEKYAVAVGGGKNHRFGRFDGVVIKKEDIALARGSIPKAIDEAQSVALSLCTIEIEVETIEQLYEVIADGRVKRIMLDNMSLENLCVATRICAGQYFLEASGVGNLNLVEVAATGVDAISLSQLITGAHPIKMHMRIER